MSSCLRAMLPLLACSISAFSAPGCSWGDDEVSLGDNQPESSGPDGGDGGASLGEGDAGPGGDGGASLGGSGGASLGGSGGASLGGDDAGPGGAGGASLGGHGGASLGGDGGASLGGGGASPGGDAGASLGGDGGAHSAGYAGYAGGDSACDTVVYRGDLYLHRSVEEYCADRDCTLEGMEDRDHFSCPDPEERFQNERRVGCGLIVIFMEWSTHNYQYFFDAETRTFVGAFFGGDIIGEPVCDGSSSIVGKIPENDCADAEVCNLCNEPQPWNDLPVCP